LQGVRRLFARLPRVYDRLTVALVVTFSGRSWAILRLRALIGQEQPYGPHEPGVTRVTLALRPPRRNDGQPSLAPWLLGGLLALVAALTVLAVVPFTLANDQLSAIKKVELVTSVVPALAFVLVGAVIVSRRPGNVVGWLCCAVGLGQCLATFGGQGQPPSLPPTRTGSLAGWSCPSWGTWPGSCPGYR
jgi:hypothetical protein